MDGVLIINVKLSLNSLVENGKRELCVTHEHRTDWLCLNEGEWLDGLLFEANGDDGGWT